MRKRSEKRLPSFFEAMIPMVSMLLILFVGKGIMGYPTEILLVIVACIAGFVALRVGVTWNEMVDEISVKIAKSMPAILILITVGCLIGSWEASGTIPMLIFYGLKIINPQYLLVTAFILCALVSVCTGTSWGSIGTVGVAIMGIAQGLGVALPAAAGAVIAGSYFGDKLSPLSDTTNLAPIAAGSELYDHIKHMLWTTVPASIVALIVYFFAGRASNVVSEVNSELVTTMLKQLDSLYSWNILLALPVLIVLIGSFKKLPTIPVMLASSFVAAAEGMIFQGISFGNVLTSMVKGFKVDMILGEGMQGAGILKEVVKLLSRGGMASMMSTTLLIFCAFCFAGIVVRSKCLEVILGKLLSVVKTDFGLIASTVASCIIMALTTGNSYLSILVPGEMFKDAYKKRGLAAVNLSRTLEDSATVIVPIVPWSAAGAFCAGAVGVEVLSYAPWAVLCYTGFIFALIYGATGIGIKRIPKEDQESGEFPEIKVAN